MTSIHTLCPSVESIQGIGQVKKLHQLRGHAAFNSCACSSLDCFCFVFLEKEMYYEKCIFCNMCKILLQLKQIIDYMSKHFSGWVGFFVFFLVTQLVSF